MNCRAFNFVVKGQALFMEDKIEMSESTYLCATDSRRSAKYYMLFSAASIRKLNLLSLFLGAGSKNEIVIDFLLNTDLFRLTRRLVCNWD